MIQTWGVEIYDGSGEPFVETDADQAFIDLFAQLHHENRSRYELQAKDLLRQGLLLVLVGNSILKYWLEDEGAAYNISDDHGVTFSNTLGLTPLHWRRGVRIRRLVEQFAHSEARATLEI
jgi:methylphosphotriester-DNA--protein-cysteine methyltransferase